MTYDTERIESLYARHQSCDVVAGIMGVSPSTVRKVLKPTGLLRVRGSDTFNRPPRHNRVVAVSPTA